MLRLASAAACLLAAAAAACLRAAASAWLEEETVDQAAAAQGQTPATCPAVLGQLVSAQCPVAHDPTDSLLTPVAVDMN